MISEYQDLVQDVANEFKNFRDLKNLSHAQACCAYSKHQKHSQEWWRSSRTVGRGLSLFVVVRVIVLILSEKLVTID
jgi:hypothetical protein